MTLASVAFYLGSLSIATVVLFAAFGLTKRYPYRFLTYFLYYLLFFYFHCILYYTNISFNILLFPGASDSFVAALSALMILSAPAQVLYLYFFLLWVWDVLGRTAPRWFAPVYFPLQLILMLPVLWKFVRKMDTGNADVAGPGASLFPRFGIVLFILAAVYLFLGARRQPNPHKRRLARILGPYYAVGFVTILLLTDVIRLPFYTDAMRLILFIAFLNFFFNVPPLLYLRRVLKRFPLEPARTPLGEPELMEFSSRHQLSRREMEIVGLIMEGLGTKEIGEKLFISGKTVKNNLSNIFLKTGAKNRVQLLAFIQKGRP